jgi:hypothetical protein
MPALGTNPMPSCASSGNLSDDHPAQPQQFGLRDVNDVLAGEPAYILLDVLAGAHPLHQGPGRGLGGRGDARTASWSAMTAVAATLTCDCLISEAASFDLLRGVDIPTLVLASAGSDHDLRGSSRDGRNGGPSATGCRASVAAG